MMEYPHHHHMQVDTSDKNEALYNGVQSSHDDQSGRHDSAIDTDDNDLDSHHDAPQNGVGSSVFSYVCASVGAGILSLPSALGYCGWSGLILMLILAIACNYTADLLIGCMFAVPGRYLRTYEDIGEQAMGVTGRRLVSVFQFITLFGVCTIFLILIGGNMTLLINQLSTHDWIFVFAAILIPVAWLKTMSEVSYLAIFGVIASLFVAAVVVVNGAIRAHDSTAEKSYTFFDSGGLANAINIIVFSFGGHSVLPNIITHLKRPQENFKAVTRWSYVAIGVVYIITAAGGYAGWGADVSSQVLFSMDPSSTIVKIAYAFITAHVVLAYPIPLNPVSLQIERIFGIDKQTGRTEIIMRVISRTLLVLSTVFIASVVPYFGDILQLVSALSIVVVAFIFPPIFYYLLFAHRGFTKAQLALMGTVAVLGVAASGIGIYYAVKGLIYDIKHHPDPFANYF